MTQTVGFIGLGKLGLPCALAMESRGLQIVGYDVDPAVAGYVRDKRIPYLERHVDALLAHTQLRVVPDVATVVAQADVVFVTVQTPHRPEFEGRTPIPDDREDFEYGYLVSACRAVAAAAAQQQRHITLVVVSTVLPGTVGRHIRPLLGTYVRLIYNPFFIAMGTTVDDFLNPEFVLLGADRHEEDDAVGRLYRQIHDKPLVRTSIESAELIKVSYNTYISLKIVWANTMMEICEKTGADVDVVTDTLAQATDRIISARYMRGGMGDSGGCHPRDNIAMSWLGRRLDLSFDLFETVMTAREQQTHFLARIVQKWQRLSGLDVCLMGTTYKPETNLELGSAALLLAHILDADYGVRVQTCDPFARTDLAIAAALSQPRVFFIGTRHEVWQRTVWPTGAVVIDPWGYIPDAPGVVVIRIGRKGALPAVSAL